MFYNAEPPARADFAFSDPGRYPTSGTAVRVGGRDAQPRSAVQYGSRRIPLLSGSWAQEVRALPIPTNNEAGACAGFLLYTIRMSWADRRRILILSAVGGALAVLLAGLLFLLLYRAPSCADGKRNGQETGVDCGGSCQYLCSADMRAPAARFVRPFSPAPGRTDVIAYIDNPNPNAAAKAAPYTLELYTRSNSLLARIDGVVDLPPGASVPLYLPSVYRGSADVGPAFVSFATTTRWYAYRDERIVPRYNFDAQVEGDATPRISATLANPSAYALRDVLVVATVFDASGNAIAASQTVIPGIAPQGIAGAVFTWNAPFAAPPARVDVVPVIPLP
jgi:hypothetical protein